MALGDKPGVLGTIGNVGQAVQQGVKNEVKKTAQNTVEQLRGKERKEMVPDAGASAEAAQQAEAARKQQSEDVVNWLYGGSDESTPAPKPTETQTADIKQQLGIEQNKIDTTGNAMQQLGLDTKPTPTASLTEQLNVLPGQTKTPEEQQKISQLKQQLHNQYYQRLTTPQKPPETEEREKEEREKRENAQQRMERLEQEDLRKKQEEAEKKKPMAVDMAQNMEKHRGSSG